MFYSLRFYSILVSSIFKSRPLFLYFRLFNTSILLDPLLSFYFSSSSIGRVTSSLGLGVSTVTCIAYQAATSVVSLCKLPSSIGSKDVIKNWINSCHQALDQKLPSSIGLKAAIKHWIKSCHQALDQKLPSSIASKAVIKNWIRSSAQSKQFSSKNLVASAGVKSGLVPVNFIYEMRVRLIGYAVTNLSLLRLLSLTNV